MMSWAQARMGQTRGTYFENWWEKPQGETYGQGRRMIRTPSHRTSEQETGMHLHTHTQNRPSFTVVGIDPGRVKCGIAVVNSDGQIVSAKSVSRERLTAEALKAVSKSAPAYLAVGDATGSAEIAGELKAAFPQAKIVIADERNSTQEGISLCLLNTAPILRWLTWLLLFAGAIKPDGWAAAVIARRSVADFSGKLYTSSSH